ncbi:MAG: hypothetical protein ABEK59_12805 [Halobacteria archaeon]
MAQLDDINSAVFDNAIYDPLQGYDADVWAIDQATGTWSLVGRFTSIELVFRNTTRPYIEFNQRVMRQLDGNFMIGWTMERGLLDGRVLQNTFGYHKISRTDRINRHPRMQIVFQLNAPELSQDKNFANTTNYTATQAPNQSPVNSNFTNAAANVQGQDDRGTSEFVEDSNNNAVTRDTTSMMVLKFCKVETFTIRAEAGDEVISNRWEGVSEGYEVLDRTSVWAGHYLDDQGGTFAQDIIGNPLQEGAPNENLGPETEVNQGQLSGGGGGG